MLHKTCPGFQEDIRKIAAVANLTPEGVYNLWRGYSDGCLAADQSAVLFEFVQWYRAKLGSNEPALREAIGHC